MALTGSFRITAQVGGTATAMASLTGTLNDQPVQYEFMFNALNVEGSDGAPARVLGREVA